MPFSTIAIFELAAIVATITGVNLRTLLSRSEELENSAMLIQLISVFDPLDEITGHWKLSHWEFKPGLDEREKEGMDVCSGSLSVLYKYPRRQRWRGVMTLSYERTGGVPLPKWLRKWTGNLVHAVYDVDLFKKKGQYHGTTSLLWREPKSTKAYSGLFETLEIDDNGRLSGKFKNENTTSWADPVIFHQRVRWSELQGYRRLTMQSSGRR